MPTKCTAEGCAKVPRYNLPGQKGGIYCKECAARINADMVNVVGRKCETCGKSAAFNFADEKGKKGEGARFCKEHALPDMVNIVSKRCKKCTKIPCFNNPGDKTGVFCKDHAEEGMVDVTNRQCADEGCTTSPTFNTPGHNIGKFCASHALPGMENVTAKRCSKCSKQARFNKPECASGLYCAEHAENGMIDVLCKRCPTEGCSKQPTFNWPGQRPEFCFRHATKGMVDCKSLMCTTCGETQPSFNFPGERPEYCSKHAAEGMVDVRSTMCTECGDAKANLKYDGHCLRCFVYKFPDQKVSRTYKVKETHVSDFLDAALEHTGIKRVFDRRVDGGCSLRRPDMYIDCLTHVVLQETDELQHKLYSCENKRTVELYLDFGSRPIVFVRFNPDAYTDAKEVKQASCFKYHKTLHVPFVPVENKAVWETRLDVLRQRLLHHISTIPEKEVTVEHLFYDGYE